MPRDINGNYTLPAGNPVIAGTIIEADWANTTMEDIATALQDSLSRTGQGGMLTAIDFSDGSEASPGITWTNEPTSGFYREEMNSFWFSVANNNVININASGVSLAPGMRAGYGFATGLIIDDDQPTGSDAPATLQWFESDSGGLYLRYQNPDLTYTWIKLNNSGVFVANPNPRVVSEASNAAPEIDLDSTDMYILTALGEAADFAPPIGSYTEGVPLLIRILDDGTPRALTWDAVFRAVGTTLPTTTVAGKTLYLGCFVNAEDSTIDVVGVRQET